MWTTTASLRRPTTAENFFKFKAALTFLFLTTISASFSGCQTAPQKEEAFGNGVVWRYETDIYVEQTENQKTQSNKVRGFLDIVEGSGFRLEVLSTADVPVATVVMTDREVSYALHLEKTFYSGKTNPHALDPVFPLPVKPREIEAIFREQVLPEQKCVRDQSQQLLSCTAQSPVPYEVLWEKRGIAGPLAGKPTKVTLRLTSNNIELRFYIRNINRAEANKGLLLLASPKGFSARKVPEK